ncbi:hypothetical protein JZY06_08020 [Corynebacterium sp. CCM 8862]|uniref:Uncharacterized protein n=1 Tax=Corynebacterium mendelii TaxID=2765362 RepID=A0A939IU50_9CORY|nr:hypothetical protein [Corynebacterium mendelii]
MSTTLRCQPVPHHHELAGPRVLVRQPPEKTPPHPASTCPRERVTAVFTHRLLTLPASLPESPRQTFSGRFPLAAEKAAAVSARVPHTYPKHQFSKVIAPSPQPDYLFTGCDKEIFSLLEAQAFVIFIATGIFYTI